MHQTDAREYTPRELQLLREKREAGWGTTELARLLGRSTNSVAAKIRKLRLPNKPLLGRAHSKPADIPRAGKSTLPPLPSLSGPPSPDHPHD